MSQNGGDDSEKEQLREPEVIDGETGLPDPTPTQVKLLGRTLASLRDVRIAIAKVIRAEVAGEVEHVRARGLVWMLRELGDVIEVERFEQRLSDLEARAGLPGSLKRLN